MLSNSDLLRAIHCVRLLIEAPDHDRFVDVLVRAMHSLMRAKVTGYNEADTVRKRFAFVVHPRKAASDRAIKAWVDHAHENPLIQHLQANPGDFSVYKITDFVPQRAFRKTALCQKVYREMGAEYQIAMPFPVPGPAAVAVVFNRDYDFAKRDRELLTLVQPLIAAAYLNIQTMADLRMRQEEIGVLHEIGVSAKKTNVRRPSLSRRQNEVFRQLVQGKTNKQIAAQTNLSVRTIEKYVEHLLKKLNVPNRAAVCAQFHSQLREAG